MIIFLYDYIFYTCVFNQHFGNNEIKLRHMGIDKKNTQSKVDKCF